MQKKWLILLFVFAIGCASSKTPGLAAYTHRKNLNYCPVTKTLQKSSSHCGVAALASVLNYWDQPTEYSTLLKNNLSADVRGYSLEELKNICEEHTLKGFILTYSEEESSLNKLIQEHIALGRPVITALGEKKWLTESQHYVTVIGYDPQRILVMDPAEGYREISRERFERLWGNLGKNALVCSQ